MRKLLLPLITGLLLSVLFSCEKDTIDNVSADSALKGIVTDLNGQPISDVAVTLSSINEEDIITTTNDEGEFLLKNLFPRTYAVTFSKKGWLTISQTVTPKMFVENEIVNIEAEMINASAKITGYVYDAKDNDNPLSGVNVSVGVAGSSITDNKGYYEIEDLIETNYTLILSKEGYKTVEQEILISDFDNGIAIADVRMGSKELLRGLTAEQLKNADKWYFNEYRGGRNADSYPHWDWACNYMSTLDFNGAWEEQNEGTTLQIRNSNNDKNNPSDKDVFDSFVYGSKLITEQNKILSLRARTHSASEESPVYFGVQVIDLNVGDPQAVKIGENIAFNSGDYTDFEFDLGEYIGKEVIIAIGTYRYETGDYWKQLVLRAIRFADVKVENWDWLPGNEVVEGWKLTVETVQSTMPHTKTNFTGISPVSGGRDNYVEAYRAWRDVAHIGAEWFFAPLKKDPEVFPSEGYLIKTRNTADVDTKIPESYFYAKFSIKEGANQLVLSTRNFGSNYTYFKVSAVENSGTVTHLSPISNTAQEAEVAEDGCWKFKHGSGGKDSPKEYANFNYDLSSFNGSDVVLVIGVYNGAPSTGENKLVLYSVELN